MKTVGKTGTMAVVLTAFALAFASCSAAAVDRSKGEFWTYDVSATAAVGTFDVPVEGTVTYEFEEERSLSINTNEIDVNIMRLDGVLTGSLEPFGQPFLEVAAAVGGFVYETVGGGGLVKEDSFLWTNATVGSGVVTVTFRFALESIITYSPPLLSGFDPDSTELGDSWEETVVASSSTITWENGSISSRTYDNETLTCNVVVASSAESVDTPAGAFDAKRITVTNQKGNYEVHWWSDKAGNFVKQESFNVGSATPYDTMILRDFGKSGGGSLLLILGVGVGATLLAVLVLIVVLVLMRRPRSPSPAPFQSSGAVSHSPETNNVISNR